jgi:hypothetical protein
LADDAFPISGSIDPKGFPFLLMDLHRQGATGSLKVDGPTYQKALYFRGGRILFGSSNDPKDQLGAILIESGRITPEQLEDVNGKVGPGSPLAKVLAESGFVSQRELSEAARAKVERILADTLSYDSGSFDFEDGVLPKGAVDLKLATDKLVLSAVRRIAERPFVLRHIESLETVLSLTPGAAERLADVTAESGRLGDFLDGTRSIKEAAAAARLDEFDAAKVACGLLFLGLVSPPQGASAPVDAVEAAGFAIVPGDELDLGQTARMAFAASPSESPSGASRSTAPPEPEPALDPSAFAPPPLVAVPEPEPAPRLEPPLARTRPGRLEPETMYIEPSAKAPAVTPHAATRALPLTAPPPRPSATDTKPPAPARDIRLPSMEAGFEATGHGEGAPKSRPPSREDLAALDALLNSTSLEGPLTPFDKQPAASWEPHSSRPAPRPRQRRGGGGGRALMGLVTLLVLAVGGGVWYQFFRETPTAVPPSAAPSPVTRPTTTTTLSPGAGDPTPLVSAEPPAHPTPDAPATTVVTTTLPAAPPTATPPPTPAKRPAGPAGSLADARSAMDGGDFPRAARTFAAQLRNSGRGAYSVQLLVACSEDTVAKAARNVSAKELFILPAEYRGRSCYRVCWGVYESEAAARSAVSAIPEYFRKGGASPKAVPTVSILP